MDVVPWFDCHNFWLFMPIDRLIDNWGDLVGSGGRRPLVDSHSIGVWWKHGICSINAKFFMPHYDPANAALPPNWKDHIFGTGNGPRWILTADKAASLPA